MKYGLLDPETDIIMQGDESLRCEFGTNERIWHPVPKWSIGLSAKQMLTVRRPLKIVELNAVISEAGTSAKADSLRDNSSAPSPCMSANDAKRVTADNKSQPGSITPNCENCVHSLYCNLNQEDKRVCGSFEERA